MLKAAFILIAMSLAIVGRSSAAGPTTAPTAPATAPSTPLPIAQLKVPINVVVGKVGQPNNAAEMQRRAVEQQRTYITGLKESGTFKQDDLIRLSLVDGTLRAESSLTASARGQTRVKVSDATGDWLVMCQDFRRRGNANVGLMVVINRYDFDKTGEGEYWQTIFNLNDQYLMLHEQGIDGGAWFQQMNGSVHMNVNSVKNGRAQMVMNLQAPTLLQLYAEHPEEVRKYLVPMLLRLTGQNVLKPGAADVYAVFDEVRADPAVAAKLTKLLPKLDAELFSDRDAASSELARLGNAGILAVSRLDRNRLSEEQKGRLDAFLSTQRRRTINDPAASRKDTGFLLDALEDEDPAVRLAAKACLEAAVGHPVIFDTALPPEKLAAAVDALRQSLKGEPQGRAAFDAAIMRLHR